MSLAPEKGKVLLSEPFIEDPNFSRTVVLITEYGNEGTVGYVLNQKTELTVDMLMPDLEMVGNSVFNGGPVEIESFHYIHTYKEIEGAVDIGQGMYWSGSFEEVVAGLIDGSFEAKNFKFFIGYSGWAEGQLEAELKEEAWVVADLDKTLIFNVDLQDKKLWQLAMQGLGGEFAILANSPINPQLN